LIPNSSASAAVQCGPSPVMKVSTPSAAARAMLPPAPPVTMPIFLQTLGPPRSNVGGAPRMVFKRLLKISRHKRVLTRSPMGAPCSSKNGLGLVNFSALQRPALLPRRGWASSGKWAL